MEYVRRRPRGVWRSAAMLSYAGDNHALGEVLDISTDGAAMTLPTALRPGTSVRLLIDPECLPASISSGGLPSLTGTVTWSRRDSAGPSPRHRVGIRFSAVPPAVTRRLEQLTALVQTEPGPRIDRALAATSAGRERLYQHAAQCIAAGDLDGARQSAGWALQAAPRSRELRALVCRIRAEEALAANQVSTAAKQIALGLTLAPDDEALEAMTARIPATPPSRSMFSRIFGRRSDN